MGHGTSLEVTGARQALMNALTAIQARLSESFGTDSLLRFERGGKRDEFAASFLRKSGLVNGEEENLAETLSNYIRRGPRNHFEMETILAAVASTNEKDEALSLAPEVLFVPVLEGIKAWAPSDLQKAWWSVMALEKLVHEGFPLSPGKRLKAQKALTKVTQIRDEMQAEHVASKKVGRS